MKQKCLIIIIFLIICSTVFAQNESEGDSDSEKERSFSFQTNPLWILTFFNPLRADKYGGYSVFFDFEFQYAINNFLNISINPQFNFNKNMIYPMDYHTKGYRFIIAPGLLFRPFQTRLKGMYIGAHVPIGFLHREGEEYTKDYGNGFIQSYPDINENLTLLGMGLSAGYQWIFRNGFTISLGAGGQIIWFISSKKNREVSKALNPYKLLIFGLGYSF